MSSWSYYSLATHLTSSTKTSFQVKTQFKILVFWKYFWYFDLKCFTTLKDLETTELTRPTNVLLLSPGRASRTSRRSCSSGDCLGVGQAEEPGSARTRNPGGLQGGNLHRQANRSPTFSEIFRHLYSIFCVNLIEITLKYN